MTSDYQKFLSVYEPGSIHRIKKSFTAFEYNTLRGNYGPGFTVFVGDVYVVVRHITGGDLRMLVYFANQEKFTSVHYHSAFVEVPELYTERIS